MQGFLLTAPDGVEAVVRDAIGPSVATTRKEEGRRDDGGGELHLENDLSGCGEKEFYVVWS